MMAAWFTPRRFGYGATPKSWQGWLLAAVYLAIVLGATWMFLPTDEPLPTIDWGAWLALVVGATAAAAWISYRTTDGAWRWRWGGRNRGTH